MIVIIITNTYLHHLQEAIKNAVKEDQNNETGSNNKLGNHISVVA